MSMRIYAVVAGACAVSALTGCGDWSLGGSKKNEFSYRTAPIAKTDIVRTVEATGTITPRNSAKGIPVGAQVNGKIIKLFVDYNSTVTNGQIVALIDPLVYEASYKSAVAQLHVNEANLMTRQAALKSAEAELELARKTYARKSALVERKTAPVADLDSAEESLKRAEASVESAKAAITAAEASIEQSRATSDKAKADLEYCTIVSPVDGIVIDRKVDEGETVVSSMNAVPVLTIAEDLNTVWVEATIPEADVGNIKPGQPVTFTADAYRRKFTGTVKQVRRAATSTNNVVTFPVIIEAENPDCMLFPGMTATLSIETAREEDVLAVAAAAFRFRPKPEDAERIGVEIPRGRKLWLKPADPNAPLEFISVSEGISDGSFIKIVCTEPGRLESLEGREAVVGYETKSTKSQDKDVNNPFMPKFPQRNKNKGTAPEPKHK